MHRKATKTTKTTVTTIPALAKALGLSVSRVNVLLAQGMPGSPGAYCVEDCQGWCFSNVSPANSKLRQQTLPGTDADPLLSGDGSPALERYREERAKLARLDRMERERQLLRRDSVHELLSRVASILRGAGEILQRQFGPDALTILDEALNDVQPHISDLYASSPDDLYRSAQSGGGLVSETVPSAETSDDS